MSMVLKVIGWLLLILGLVVFLVGVSETEEGGRDPSLIATGLVFAAIGGIMIAAARKHTIAAPTSDQETSRESSQPDDVKAVDEKARRILRARTDMADADIDKLGNPEAWDIIYRMNQGELPRKAEVLFTGFGPVDRDSLERFAWVFGLKVVKSVTQRLSMLVCGPNAGAVKIQKAQEKGDVIIMSAEQFTTFTETGEIP